MRYKRCVHYTHFYFCVRGGGNRVALFFLVCRVGGMWGPLYDKYSTQSGVQARLGSDPGRWVMWVVRVGPTRAQSWHRVRWGVGASVCGMPLRRCDRASVCGEPLRVEDPGVCGEAGA